jgi:hypothetical protein
MSAHTGGPYVATSLSFATAVVAFTSTYVNCFVCYQTYACTHCAELAIDLHAAKPAFLRTVVPLLEEVAEQQRRRELLLSREAFEVLHRKNRMLLYPAFLLQDRCCSCHKASALKYVFTCDAAVYALCAVVLLRHCTHLTVRSTALVLSKYS